MLYLFTGDDTEKKLKAHEQFAHIISKDTEKFFITQNNFNRAELERFYSGAGLFTQKTAVFYESILEREEVRDFVLRKLENMAESENTFVFLDGKLNKPITDAFKKAGAKLEIFELPKEKKERFNSFLLANALGSRDKKNLWLYFRQAMAAGVALDELAGVLFWKVKDMLLKKNFGKYTPLELEDYASKLSYLLPEARRNGSDAEAAFEQFLLEVF